MRVAAAFSGRGAEKEESGGARGDWHEEAAATPTVCSPRVPECTYTAAASPSAFSTAPLIRDFGDKAAQQICATVKTPRRLRRRDSESLLS